MWKLYRGHVCLVFGVKEENRDKYQTLYKKLVYAYACLVLGMKEKKV